MITVTPEAVDAIQTIIAERGSLPSIRIHLRSTGCCDASLGLMADSAGADDLTCTVQGMTFVISQELNRLTGNITITCVREKHQTGFTLTPERPISEWDGFGVCTLNA